MSESTTSFLFRKKIITEKNGKIILERKTKRFLLFIVLITTFSLLANTVSDYIASRYARSDYAPERQYIRSLGNPNDLAKLSKSEQEKIKKKIDELYKQPDPKHP